MSDHHENPLSLELKSLRATVARFQEEAHASAVKLQRHSLDAVRVHERAGQLERENDLLKAELAILRAHPHSESATSAKHVQDQLTLSLRRQSQKTTLAEETIAAKTTEIAQLKAEVYRAQVAAENAYELGARVRGREEELKTRQREMAVRIAQLEEDLRMADKVIKEYAALVRGMEKSTSSPDASLSTVLDEARRTHDELLAKHQVDTEYMQTELQAMLSRLEATIAQLEAEKKAKEALEKELGRVQTELEKHRLDDSTAAKMVARYMQFSQTSTNDLLSTLSALKARHEGTLSTLSAQNHQLSVSLASLSAQNDRLRNALDEAGGELAKEAYGRRREVALRIRMGRREARLAESLRRWVRNAEERLAKLTHAREYEMLADVIQGARIVLEQIDEGVADAESAVVISGEGARKFLVDDGVEGLLEELRLEMERRVHLEKALAKTYVDSNDNVSQEAPGLVNESSTGVDPTSTAEDAIPPAVPEKSPVLSSRPGTVPFTTPSTNVVEVVSAGPDISTSIDNLGQQSVGVTATTPEPTSSMVNDQVSPVETTPRDVSLVESVTSNPGLGESEPRSSITPPPLSPKVLSHIEDEGEANAPPESASGLGSVDADTNPESEALATLHSDSTLADSSSSSSAPSMTTETTLSPTVSNPPSPTTPTEIATEATEHATSKIPDPEYQPDVHQASHAYTPIDVLNQLEQSSAAETQVCVDIPPAPIHAPDSAPEVVVEVPASSVSSPSLPPPSPPPPPPPPPPHPLLTDLARVSKRYDDLQRAFRDCHLALEGLQSSLKESSSGNGSTPSALAIPQHILTAAVARLDDYTEDARVELEIRIGDEVLLAKGYEALLSVPGAMSSGARQPKQHRSGDQDVDEDDDEPVQSEVEKQISDFVAGTDPTVRRAKESLSRKLEDVQHDIAALKRAIYDPDAFSAPSGVADTPQSASFSPSSSSTNLALPSSPPTQTAGWSSWIRTPTLSRPSSPAPPSHGPAPTFGNIMTAPRLRSSSSTASLRQDGPRSRRPSFFGLAGSPPEKEKDPLGVLGLKVPMPSFGYGFTPASPPPTSGATFGFGRAGGILSPTSPMAPMIHAAPGAPRSRTVSSTMYMLGLGASATALPRMGRSISGAPTSASPLASEVRSTEVPKTADGKGSSGHNGVRGSESDDGADEDNDSDVE